MNVRIMARCHPGRSGGAGYAAPRPRVLVTRSEGIVPIAKWRVNTLHSKKPRNLRISYRASMVWKPPNRTDQTVIPKFLGLTSGDKTAEWRSGGPEGVLL